MASLGDRIQHADWKKEKHAPVIECPATVRAGEVFDVKAGLGKEIAHPNTIEHHINYITLYFQPEGSKFVHQVGHYEFSAHGEGTAYASPTVVTSVKLDKSGAFYAVALCNIHGLWESTREVRVTS